MIKSSGCNIWPRLGVILILINISLLGFMQLVMFFSELDHFVASAFSYSQFGEKSYWYLIVVGGIAVLSFAIFTKTQIDIKLWKKLVFSFSFISILLLSSIFFIQTGAPFIFHSFSNQVEENKEALVYKKNVTYHERRCSGAITLQIVDIHFFQTACVGNRTLWDSIKSGDVLVLEGMVSDYGISVNSIFLKSSE